MEKSWLRDYLQLWVIEALSDTAVNAVHVFTRTKSGFPQSDEFFECDQFMLELEDGAAVVGKMPPNYSFQNYIPNPA